MFCLVRRNLMNSKLLPQREDTTTNSLSTRRWHLQRICTISGGIQSRTVKSITRYFLRPSTLTLPLLPMALLTHLVSDFDASKRLKFEARSTATKGIASSGGSQQGTNTPSSQRVESPSNITHWPNGDGHVSSPQSSNMPKLNVGLGDLKRRGSPKTTFPTVLPPLYLPISLNKLIKTKSCLLLYNADIQTPTWVIVP
jgi:hypothetical protein